MSANTYVLTDGAGNIVQYPWSLDQMIMANPTVSFSVPISDEVAAEYNTFPVTDTPQPIYNPMTQDLNLVDPVLQADAWLQQWSVTDVTPEVYAVRLAAYRAGLSCSPLQGKIELDNRGLLDDAETIVANADKTTKLAWANATIWKRTSPMIESLGAELGLTADDMDNLFVVAAQIYV